MLTCYASNGSPLPSPPNGEAASACIWFDLLDPTEEEKRQVELATRLALPDRKSVGGVELSSRVAIDGDALRLNVPYFTHGEDLPPTPVGIVLTAIHLVSVRYAVSEAFDLAAKKIRERSAPCTGMNAFVVLVETIVGMTADRMESIAADVGTLSERVFKERHGRSGVLRDVLGEVGHVESRLTRARQTSSGLLRIVTFAQESGLDWVTKPDVTRLKIERKDLDGLCELDAQLTDKLQFLLDAALGFINIDQNDVMKVLTVASVAAIPPVILAGIWGMNFQHMPELHWPHGYAMGLIAIMLSIVVPMLWFKRRGWI